MERNRLLTKHEWSKHPVTLKGYPEHPTPAPELVRFNSTIRLCSCVLSGNMRSIGILGQHHLSCGRPTE